MSKIHPAPLVPDALVGIYRIIRKVATTSLRAVYLALDVQGQPVTIAEYLPVVWLTRATGEQRLHINPENLVLYQRGLQNFFTEGQVLARISHPSVLRVSDNFFANETAYRVMNHLEGTSLQDFIITARELTNIEVFRESTIHALFDEILLGLRLVHQHKLLHLDIKPAHIFITEDNKSVLFGFGAAPEILGSSDDFSQPKDTLGFAAPERYRNDKVMGPWTDIYAVGACLFACMQGEPPDVALQRLVKDRMDVALGRLRGLYSDNLIEVVTACLSLDPLARPQSVFALQKALNRPGPRCHTPLRVS
jgi:serine/threonine protein kinase